MTVETDHKTADVLIIGGGAIGLAIGLELRSQGAAVTILCRDFAEAASHAAAGMLAPQAEGILPGPMLDLCLGSRALYPDWIQKLEAMTGLDSGYWPCGILAPAYVATDVAHPADAWLESEAVHALQAGLSEAVIGGWWFPDDGQVDNQQLTRLLWLAAQEQGITLREGVTVQTIGQQPDRITHLQTSEGDWQAQHYVLATGAWAQALLPIPVTPRKGQMLSVQVPWTIRQPEQLPLKTVLFGTDIYIVPRRDGRIILGATNERVGFTGGNTAIGMQRLLIAATRLFPALGDFPIQRFWWGFRPSTPDELPILGPSPYRNLTLATGHHRNGILLMPMTAQVIADYVLHQRSHPLLPHFHWSRESLQAPPQV